MQKQIDVDREECKLRINELEKENEKLKRMAKQK
jgi:hypothetical protein